MADRDLGPLWSDCYQLIGELVGKREFGVEVRLVPQIGGLYGASYSRWVVGAHLRQLGPNQVWSCSAQASFGAGGAFKTAPAALYRALLKLQEDKEAYLLQRSA